MNEREHGPQYHACVPLDRDEAKGICHVGRVGELCKDGLRYPDVSIENSLNGPEKDKSPKLGGKSEANHGESQTQRPKDENGSTTEAIRCFCP